MPSTEPLYDRYLLKTVAVERGIRNRPPRGTVSRLKASASAE